MTAGASAVAPAAYGAALGMLPGSFQTPEQMTEVKKPMPGGGGIRVATPEAAAQFKRLTGERVKVE